MTRFLSWEELLAFAKEHDIPVTPLPFCRCSNPSPNRRSAAPSRGSPSPGRSPYAGIPRDQWRSARKTRPSSSPENATGVTSATTRSKPVGITGSPDGAWLRDGTNETALGYARSIMKKWNASKRDAFLSGIPRCSRCGRIGTFDPCPICTAGKTSPTELHP